MAREFFKNLPDTSTPLTAERLNGLLDGEEAMGNLVVDSIKNKNLLSLTNLVNNGTGRTSYSINGNNITITTLSSGTYRFVRKIIDNLEIGKTYTIHIAYWNDTTVDMLAQWGVTTPDGSSYYGNSPITLYQEQKLTFVPTETSVQFRVGYLSNSCTAGDILTVGEIQLEEGAEPTWFTPYDTYSNKALANEDVVVGTIRSKNMFDINNIVIGKHYSTSQGTITDNASWNMSNFIPVKPNEQYAFSFIGQNSGFQVTHTYYDSNFNLLGGYSSTSNPTSPYVITAPSTAVYIKVEYRNDKNATNFQVEEGDTATTYSPYQNLNATPYTLWQNSSPTSSFASQTITLNDNINNYSYIEIIYRHDATYGRMLSTGKIPAGMTAMLMLMRHYNYFRLVENATGTTMNVGNCSYFSQYGNTSTTQSNDYCIPYRIIGYK